MAAALILLLMLRLGLGSRVSDVKRCEWELSKILGLGDDGREREQSAGADAKRVGLGLIRNEAKPQYNSNAI